MGRLHETISPELQGWMESQRIFFVATAPLSADGHVNCSPKGLDCFRVLGPTRVAYLDLGGSGIETVAHVRENRRIVLMFCAFTGPPKIVRLHGLGTVFTAEDEAFEQFKARFPQTPGTRSIIQIDVDRISDSCGFGVPMFDTAKDRDTLVRYHQTKGEKSVDDFRMKNSQSIDGLPGF